MPALSDYSNIYGVAIEAIKKRGYQFWYDQTQELFFAEQGGWDFCASSPTALLGLLVLREDVNPKEYQEYWWCPADASKKSYLKTLTYSPSRSYVSVDGTRHDAE